MHAKAQEWANRLANVDAGMPHSGMSGVGESIYMTTKGTGPIRGDYPVRAWYDEKTQFKYDFKEHNYSPATGLYSSVKQCECAHFLN